MHDDICYPASHAGKHPGCFDHVFFVSSPIRRHLFLVKVPQGQGNPVAKL